MRGMREKIIRLAVRRVRVCQLSKDKPGRETLPIGLHIAGCNLNEAACSFAGLLLELFPERICCNLLVLVERNSVGLMIDPVGRVRLRGNVGASLQIESVQQFSPWSRLIASPFVFSVSQVPFPSVFTASSLHFVKPFSVLPSWAITAAEDCRAVIGCNRADYDSVCSWRLTVLARTRFEH